MADDIQYGKTTKNEFGSFVEAKFMGRKVLLETDPKSQAEQLERYRKKFTEDDNRKMGLAPDGTPIKKVKFTDEQIEKRYASDVNVVGPEQAAINKQRLIDYNKKLEENESASTSKETTPEPVPSSTPVPTVIPETKTQTTVENGTTKSTTVSVEKSPDPVPAKPPVVSTSSSEAAPVASTDPVVYSSSAKSNKVSEKVHVVNAQEHKKEDHPKILTKVSEDLISTESSIKTGGNQIISYEKDKHESIGSVINTFPCIRKDESGEFRPKSISVEGKGSFVNYAPVSYTEEVENTRFPCGTYSLNVGNKYDLSVGAGGASISTGGNMRLGSKGRTLISSAEEINVSSGNGNVNIRAAHNISLKGDSVTLEAPNQVVVNTNLGIARNAVINGCAFVDGELYVNHITCPAEVQYTGGGIGSFGQLMVGCGPTGSIKGNGGGGAIIAYADVSYIKQLLTTALADSRGDTHAYSWSMPDKVPVMVLPDSSIGLASSVGNTAASNPEYSVFVYPHEHPFNNVPISFTTGNEQMRARASVMNSGNIGTAAPIQHGYKTPTA